MTFKPAHKDTTTPPGQVVNHVTLGDYIASKQRTECCGNPLRGCMDCPPPKKLTFDEWLRQSSFVEPDAGTYEWLKDCWNAAQVNKA